MRATPSGAQVCGFGLAVNRVYRDASGANREDVSFFDCSAWRQTGEFVCRYFHKGSMIVVSGRMQSRKYQDRDGNNRTAWEIQADNVYFGESKRDSENNSYSQSSYTGQSGFSKNSNDTPRQSAPVPPVTPSPFEELEDDGELPF